MQTDVVIVGAGPAGSVAAHRLASAGVRVALLEQATFPRDKSCGDGVTGRGLAVLERLGLGDWATHFHRPNTLRICSPDGQRLEKEQLELGDDYCYGRLIPRRLLDERLARAAVEAGAQLMERMHVTAVEWRGSNVCVLVDGQEIATQLVILSDGSHAPITRRLNLASRLAELVAIRQYFVGDGGPEDRMEIHFERSVLPLYTWLFPLGDGWVNIGTATFTRRTRRGDVNLREVLARFVADPKATEGRLTWAEPVGPVRGHPLRTRLDSTCTHAERVLVTGDAAGLVSPLTGEGIASAMGSGELAATHALAALKAGDFSAQTLASYSQALEARYGADQRAARFLRLASSIPRLFNHIFRRLRQDDELALLIGHIIIGHKSPRLALRPTTLLRLLV